MSLEKISIHIFYFLLIFFHHFATELWRIPCILDISPLIYKWFENIFSPTPLCCMFICWWLPGCRSFLVWCGPLIYFIFVATSRIKNHCRDLCQGAYCLFFFLGFYDFKSYIQVFNTFWVNWVWCKIVVPFYFFACDWPVSQRPLLVTFSRYILGSFAVNSLAIYSWVYFWALVLSYLIHVYCCGIQMLNTSLCCIYALLSTIRTFLESKMKEPLT